MAFRLKFSNPYHGELCRKSKQAFEMRYKGQDRNISVLIPKKKVTDRLEEQTRGICAECAGKVVLWMPHHLAGY